MRLRDRVSLLLVALVAALPTLVSLCELRCVSPGTAPEATSDQHVSSSCSGHETDGAGEAPRGTPAESSHECRGHVLLAKSGSVGFGFQPARHFAGLAVVCDASDTIAEPLSHAGILSISSDLSPPSSRSPAVLRL